jgi:hypothetical protein
MTSLRLPGNEKDYCQWIINSLDRFPSTLCASPDNALMAWGSEMVIPGAGRKCIPGSKDRGDTFGRADLMLVDEEGMTWLVEAKVTGTTELDAWIWDRQLKRYRDALANCSWEDLHEYIQRFAGHTGEVKPRYAKFQHCRDLVEMIETWQQHIGRRKMAPEKIRDRIANQLRNGTHGIMVISDLYESSVAASGERFEHDGPLAVVQALPDSGRLDAHVRWYRKPDGVSLNIPVPESRQSYFRRYRADRSAKRTPANLPDLYDDSVRYLWFEHIVPELKALGWQGHHISLQKSVVALTPVNGRLSPLVRIGYSDTDAAYVKAHFKQHGAYSMKLDFAAGQCRNKGVASRELMEKWAREYYKVGWRGSGAASRAGEQPLTDEQFRKWSMMRYKPSPGIQEFQGRDEEPDAVHAFFEVTRKFIRDIEST